MCEKRVRLILNAVELPVFIDQNARDLPTNSVVVVHFGAQVAVEAVVAGLLQSRPGRFACV